MSVPKPALREAIDPASALPATHATIAGRREGWALRAWLLSACVFLVPLITYWPATFHEYGLRDDYSNLRESHEEPRIVIQFCASHARPIYGWMLQASYGEAGSVKDLQWLRLGSSLLLGAISLAMFRALRSFGWSPGSSLCFAVLLALVPSSQVIAGWAVGWPYAATALLALGCFFVAEGALTMGPRTGTARAAGQWTLAIALMSTSALIYQPSSLFYVVPLAGALMAQRERTLKRTLIWLATHMAFVAASLCIAYCTMSALYASGVFVKSGRIAFEQHWWEKACWFFQEAMPNALSLFVLNDNNQRDHAAYLACATVVGVLLIAGLAVEWRRHGRTRGLIWATGLFALPVFALGVSLVASERYATYRTILAMTAVLLCFLVASVRALTDRWSVTARRLLAVLVMGVALFTAQHHVMALIAVPQGNEWRLIEQGARQIRLDQPTRPRILAIAPTPADISTATIYHDEFGSLSSNSEWVPKEMFKRAMHDLHPDVANLESRYDFTGVYKLPVAEEKRLAADGHFDVVIDLHQLRGFYTDN